MGCCISKDKPKGNPRYNPGVQDKLVVSQSPTQKRKTVQSPPSVNSASLTCSTQSSTCGSSSLSSTSSSSSVAFSKVDRSFSNDFLQSCAMENLRIIGLDPIKKVGEVKQLGQGNLQKRARASSPNLTRQKSFRVEKERLPYGIVNGRSTMRSPSPSRRFNTGSTNQRQPMFSTNTHNETNRMVKANTRPASPNRTWPASPNRTRPASPNRTRPASPNRTRPASPNRNLISKERPVYLNNRDIFRHKVCSNVEGVKVDQVNCFGSFAMEDLDNPHIALDCFIFL